MSNKEIFTPEDKENLKKESSDFLNKYRNINVSRNIKDTEEQKKYNKELSKLKQTFVEKAKNALNKIKRSTGKLKDNIIKGINKFVEKVIKIVSKKNNKEVINLEKELGNIESEKKDVEKVVFNETQNELLTMYGEIFDIIMKTVPKEEKEGVNSVFANVNEQKEKAISEYIKNEHKNTDGLFL